MGVVYPSLEWLVAFQEKANSNEEYAKAAAEWEGDFLIESEVDELAVKELSDEKHMDAMVKMLVPSVAASPDEWKGSPFGNMLEKLTESSVDELVSLAASPDEFAKKMDPKVLAERFSKFTRADLKGVKFRMWIDFWHGKVRSPLELVPPKSSKEAKFALIGSYTNLKELVTGRGDSTKMVMMGKLKLKGNMGYMMKHIKAVTMITKIMGSIPLE